MNIEKIQIRNFRSIEDAELELMPRCRVLVGINESGKSNLLKAISSLGTFVPTRIDDAREPSPSEDPISEAFVRFSFSLEKNEIEEVIETSSKSIFSKSKNNPVARAKEKNLTLKRFVEMRASGLYEVDILSGKKRPEYWEIENDIAIHPGWCRPSPSCPIDYLLERKDGSKVLLKKMVLVWGADCPDLSDWLEPAETDDLVDLVGVLVTTQIKNQLPQVLFWQYSEKKSPSRFD